MRRAAVLVPECQRMVRREHQYDFTGMDGDMFKLRWADDSVSNDCNIGLSREQRGLKRMYAPFYKIDGKLWIPLMEQGKHVTEHLCAAVGDPKIDPALLASGNLCKRRLGLFLDI